MKKFSFLYSWGEVAYYQYVIHVSWTLPLPWVQIWNRFSYIISLLISPSLFNSCGEHWCEVLCLRTLVLVWSSLLDENSVFSWRMVHPLLLLQAIIYKVLSHLCGKWYQKLPKYSEETSWTLSIVSVPYLTRMYREEIKQRNPGAVRTDFLNYFP